MRVNIYAEEMTQKVKIISKEIEGQTFTGLRFYLELPVTVNGKQIQGPFMHSPDDDDSAAVTFWGKDDLRKVLRNALTQLDGHYGSSGQKIGDVHLDHRAQDVMHNLYQWRSEMPKNWYGNPNIDSAHVVISELLERHREIVAPLHTLVEQLRMHEKETKHIYPEHANTYEQCRVAIEDAIKRIGTPTKEHLRAIEIEKLGQFKIYVHERLDLAGIPVDPESPHKEAGCRIGGRLDVLLEQLMLARLDTQRVDGLEAHLEVIPQKALTLHHGNVKLMGVGLGLSNTGRTLRQALDQLVGVERRMLDEGEGA